MADGVWKGVQSQVTGRSRQLLLNKFFDPSTPSMRKVDDGEKKKRKKKKEKKKITAEIVATNVVASRPPNGDRLQRCRSCQLSASVVGEGGSNNYLFSKTSSVFRLSSIFGSSSMFSSFLRYLPFQVVFMLQLTTANMGDQLLASKISRGGVQTILQTYPTVFQSYSLIKAEFWQKNYIASYGKYGRLADSQLDRRWGGANLVSIHTLHCGIHIYLPMGARFGLLYTYRGDGWVGGRLVKWFLGL